jgi:hypothetical protein
VGGIMAICSGVLIEIELQSALRLIALISRLGVFCRVVPAP